MNLRCCELPRVNESLYALSMCVSCVACYPCNAQMCVGVVFKSRGVFLDDIYSIRYALKRTRMY